jgi:hypothetical protein
MIRLILVLAILTSFVAVDLGAVDHSAAAQCSVSPGSVVQLVGTPHLFIGDEANVLHWGGDTRGLAGKTINWANWCTVGLPQLLAMPRGDPWLSSGLPKIGEPIYLSKWEDIESQPRLLHIQSIADVELFGINEANYLKFVMDRPVWESVFGFRVSNLQIGPLASAASFAWSETDQRNYAQLLTNLENVLSAAFFASQSAGMDAAVVLPNLANCEREGLNDFDRNRNAATGLQRTQECLNRLNLGGATPVPTAATGRPNTPTNLRISVISPTQLRLTWDDVSNETGFRIYGGDPIASPPSTQVGSVGANVTTFDISGLITGRNYCYTVTAFNASGESAPTGQVCSTTQGQGFPAAPTSLSVVSATTAAVELAWADTSINEEGFYIYEGGNLITAVPANTTRWSIAGWNSTTSHCYEVVAFNSLGQSPRSNAACAGPLGATATVPVGATATLVPTSTTVPAATSLPTVTVTPMP